MQRDEIISKIESLDGQTNLSLKAYEKRSAEIVAQLQNMYEQMLKDTETRVRQQNADSAKKIQELSAEIQSISEKNRNWANLSQSSHFDSFSNIALKCNEELCKWTIQIWTNC